MNNYLKVVILPSERSRVAWFGVFTSKLGVIYLLYVGFGARLKQQQQQQHNSFFISQQQQKVLQK